MNIQTYALILLIIRLASDAFILAVLYKQIRLFRYEVEAGLRLYRKALFILSLIIFFGNFVPIAIDLLTVTSELSRAVEVVPTISLWYAFSNAITAFLSAFTIWLLYRMAARALKAKK